MIFINTAPPKLILTTMIPNTMIIASLRVS